MASMLLSRQTVLLPMVSLPVGLSIDGKLSPMAKPISSLNCAPNRRIAPRLPRLCLRTTVEDATYSNLSKPSASCLARTGGYGLGSGMRRKRATVRGTRSQYDGILPSSVSEMELEMDGKYRDRDRDRDNRAFDTLLEKSALPESQSQKSARKLSELEEKIERTIFDFRFLTLFGVVGSLLGAVLCFLKGCLFVAHSYHEYIRACFGGGVHTSRVILYLVEAVDVYLMGTVMLIFGMGLYELFVSSLEVPGGMCRPSAEGCRSTVCGSNLFGLFRLRERPKWLEIRSLDELKTKLGHVIVMILLVGMFEKSKKVIVTTSMDFLCFSASILLSSGALYLLSILHYNQNMNSNTDPLRNL